jgi:acyl-CoA synthetase (AMP-forming)/AMP-acid ligase II
MALIQDICYQAVHKYGRRIAFDSPLGRITFDRLWERVSYIAGALSDLGLKKGERIGILSGNCTDYIVYHYAAAKIGAILLVLNTRHTAQELIWALDDAAASALIISESHQGLLEALTERCESIKFTIGIGSVENAAYSTNELADAHRASAAEPKLSNTDPILLIYTSGTTGRPKGALQTHEGSVMIDRLTAQALEIRQHDVYLAFMPYFHQAGLIRTRATMTHGGTNLVPGKIDPQNLVSTLVKKRVSLTMLVPPYDTLLTEIADREKLTFPALRYIIGAGGAGPIHAERMRVFCERFDCRYMGIYGQTEVTGPATVITGEDYFSAPYSCGKPMGEIDLQIWDEKQRPAPAGTVGEIMIRSKTCIPGYWNNDEANRSLYTGEWLHTGDLARIDDDGFVYFMDRKKELIKTGGENVYPREVEDVLGSHPAIAELTVIGLPDSAGWGEKVTAVVILKQGYALSLDEVKTYCRNKIAGYKIPKELKFVAKIPRNHTGKIKKLELKEQLERL